MPLRKTRTLAVLRVESAGREPLRKLLQQLRAQLVAVAGLWRADAQLQSRAGPVHAGEEAVEDG